MFTPRTTAPNNKYYKLPYTGEGASVGQCVWYSMGRASECIQGRANNMNGSTDVENPMLNRSGYPSAKYWWDCALWQKGQKPKLGAIAVWNGNSGHVGNVEALGEDDYHCYISDYNKVASLTFGYGYRDIRSYNGSGNFLGFIYLPESVEITSPVEEDDSKHQAEVKTDVLRVRTLPSLSGSVLGYAEQGFYDVTNAGVADGYTWFQIADGQYIAKTEEVIEHSPSDLETKLEEANKTIELLNSKISNAIKILSE